MSLDHDPFVRGSTVVAGTGVPASRGDVEGHTCEHPRDVTESRKPPILHAGVAELFGFESATRQ